MNDEKSGEFIFDQPGGFLSTDDLDDLDRDSHFHRLTAEYMLRIQPRLRIMPILRYTRRAAEGDANRFHSFSPELSLLYFGRNLQASINLSVKGEWYDHRHPVFDKTRRDIAPRLFSILGYKEPLGLKNFRIDWFNAISSNSSNIDFYNSSNIISALGLGYTF